MNQSELPSPVWMETSNTVAVVSPPRVRVPREGSPPAGQLTPAAALGSDDPRMLRKPLQKKVFCFNGFFVEVKVVHRHFIVLSAKFLLPMVL